MHLGHGNYKGKTLPKQYCWWCWEIYFEAHPGAVTGEVMRAFADFLCHDREGAEDRAVAAVASKLDRDDYD